MELSKLTKIFKALSNEQRLRLFCMLYEGCQEKASKKQRKKSDDKCCGSMERAFTTACDCMSLSRSTISHHFKELQNAGLITCTRNGQSFVCTVNDETIEAIRSFLMK